MNRILRLILALGWISCCSTKAIGDDLYVDHDHGDDKSAGADAAMPLRTIRAAVKRAGAGDTIHLAPTTSPYRESVEMANRSGEPGRPITVDGHGATLLGTELLNPAQWAEVSPGLFRSADWYKTIRGDDAVIMRYFFVFDGRMERMGRTSKGPKQPWRKPEELKAGEWTFVEVEKAFYVRVEPGTGLEAARIEAPVRSSGVAISGKCEHLVIRNLTATHVYNDGYNIHGRTRDVLFQNIRAIECGDDGVSAHDDCQITVDGLMSYGNSTGMCNAGDSESESDHVVIANCHGFGYFMMGGGRHVLRNSYIDGDVPCPISVDGGGPKPESVSHMTLENVYVAASTGTSHRGVHVGKLGALEATRLTTLNLPWLVQGHASVHDSVLAGGVKAVLELRAGCTWVADRNFYAIPPVRQGQKSYSFDEYRKATGQDEGSVWEAFNPAHPPGGKGIGADPGLVPEGKSMPRSSERALP